MTHYLVDTSVAVRIALGQSRRAARWFVGTTEDPDATLIGSRLLKTELTRVMRRDERPLEYRDFVLEHVDLIPLTDGVLTDAEAILPHIKTLDAIHLASLIHTGLDAVVVTHDENMRAVAQLIGYETLDPV